MLRVDIMRQHVLPDIICSQSVTASRSVTLRNVAGHYMTLTQPHVSAAAALAGDEAGSERMMRVEGAASTQSDIMASNGVLHIIDRVLFHSSGYFSVCLSVYLSVFACLCVDDERRSGLIFGPRKGPKALRRCCCCWGRCYRFRKMPKALLIRNGQLGNFAYTFVTSLTDLPS